MHDHASNKVTRLMVSPWDVVRSSDSYTGEFWLSSGAFSFPVHRWRDDVPARLCELAFALDSVSRSPAMTKVTFGDGQHSVAFGLDVVSPGILKLVYADRVDGGLLYQERADRNHFENEVARAARSMIEVSIRRHWPDPAAALTDALALPGMKQAAHRIQS